MYSYYGMSAAVYGDVRLEIEKSFGHAQNFHRPRTVERLRQRCLYVPCTLLIRSLRLLCVPSVQPTLLLLHSSVRCPVTYSITDNETHV